MCHLATLTGGALPAMSIFYAYDEINDKMTIVNHFIEFAIQYIPNTIQINVAIVTQSLIWPDSSYLK